MAKKLLKLDKTISLKNQFYESTNRKYFRGFPRIKALQFKS